MLGDLLQQSGETDEWISRPDPEIWKAWLAALEHVRSISADQTSREGLFTTKISSKLDIHRILSGMREDDPVTRLTSDATPLKAGVVNWTEREKSQL